jgi:hypothetical protein
MMEKFGIRYVHVVRLNISEFGESQHTEGCTFLVGINWIYNYMYTEKPCDILK